MFSKLIATAALSLLAISAFAQEVPAPDEKAFEAVIAQASDTVPAAPAQPSVTSRFGHWLGSTVKSVTSVPKTFVEGFKDGYAVKTATQTSPSAPAAAISQSSDPVVASTPTDASTTSQPRKTGLASRLAALRSKLTSVLVDKQAPAPVEIRDVTPAPQVSASL